MTEIAEAEKEGSPPELPSAEPTRRSAPARESLTQPSSIAFQAITQSARFLFRGGVSVLAAMDRAGSLRDLQPPTLGETRAWHHRCAGHYATAIIRWPRLLWGYVHVLLLKPALMAAEWVTASPVRCAVALAFLAAFWFGR